MTKAWIPRAARNDALAQVWVAMWRLWEHRFQPVGPPDLSGGKGWRVFSLKSKVGFSLKAFFLPCSGFLAPLEMTARLGFGWGGRSLGGRKDIVPDESGTYDRMNPVLRRVHRWRSEWQGHCGFGCWWAEGYKPVGTPVSTGRTAGFIRWKRMPALFIVPDESGTNGRLKPALRQGRRWRSEWRMGIGFQGNRFRTPSRHFPVSPSLPNFLTPSLPNFYSSSSCASLIYKKICEIGIICVKFLDKTPFSSPLYYRRASWFPHISHCARLQKPPQKIRGVPQEADG
jgi:hypothetical protein